MTQGRSVWADPALSTNPPLSGVEVLAAVPLESRTWQPVGTLSVLCQIRL